MPIQFGSLNTRFSPLTSGPLGKILESSTNGVRKFLTEAGLLFFENSYVEDGFLEKPMGNSANGTYEGSATPFKRKIITQRNRNTILVKKRIFSSLSGQFDETVLSEDELLYVRAVKNLFRRKCEEIAFYENMLHLSEVFETNGVYKIDSLTDTFLDAIFNFLETLGFVSNASLINDIISGAVSYEEFLDNLKTLVGDSVSINPEWYSYLLAFIAFLQKARDANDNSKPRVFTTWIQDNNAQNSKTGPGVGTIELNIANNISTSLDLNGQGNCSIDIEDPYRLMAIKELEIDIAVSSAISEHNGQNSFGKVNPTLLLEKIQVIDNLLKQSRKSRNASEINFTYESDTSKIIIQLLPIGLTFDSSVVNFAGIINIEAQNAQLPQNERITGAEQIKIKQIIDLLDELRLYNIQTQQIIKDNSSKFSELRRKMRKDYLGQHIIQNMDVVHVFALSNTRDETPTTDGAGLSTIFTNVVSGLELNKGLLSQKTIDAENKFLFGPAFEQLLKSNVLSDFSGQLTGAFQGGDILNNIGSLLTEAINSIPAAILSSVRDRTFFRPDGVQIFQGPVTSVRDAFNNNKFTLTVDCSSNLHYLEISRYNFSPDNIQNDAFLTDPLTPFSFGAKDTASRLINLDSFKLLPENEARLKYLRITHGLKSGEKIESLASLINDVEPNEKNAIKSIIAHPAFKYNWKSGIFTTTADISLAQRSSSSLVSKISEASTIFGFTVADPFSTLDLADVVSVLVCGVPYSYDNFLKSILISASFDINNPNHKRMFFNTFFAYFQRIKGTFGNFIPAKNKVIPEEAYRKKALERRKNQGLLNDLVEAEKQLSEALDKQAVLSLNAESSPVVADLQKKINELKSTLSASFDGDSNVPNKAPENIEEVNSVLSYLLKKKADEVRFNKDKDYLVVDEKYDNDLFIQSAIAEIRQTNTDFFTLSDLRSPLDKCREAAALIDFEFFANKEGNIVFRQPQYNKLPASLLFKMFSIQKHTGASVLPEFIVDLVNSRSNVVRENLELKLIEGLYLSSLINIPYKFNSLIGEDLMLDASSIESFDDSGQNNVFATNIVADQAARNSESNLKKIQTKISNLKGSGNIEEINKTVSTDLQKINNPQKKNAAVFEFKTKLNSVQAEVAELIRLYKAINKKARDLAAVEATASANAAFTGIFDKTSGFGLFTNFMVEAQDAKQIPELLNDYIIPDFEPIDGFNSHKRFIINDIDIINVNYSINPPEINRVDVIGNEDLIGSSSGFTVDGKINTLYWAGGVDFDSWRQYGYRMGNPVYRADFKNPETQCAPFATYRLIREQANINTADMTVIFNEFYDVGETVYVPSKGMVYYISSVRHTMDNNNGQASTSLSLKYGRPLGEYIPTPLDILGDNLSSSSRKKFGQLKLVKLKTEISDNIKHIGAIAVSGLDSKIISETVTDKEIIESFNLSADLANIKEALSKEDFLKINNDGANLSIARIEVRSYHTGSDKVALLLANSLKSLLPTTTEVKVIDLLSDSNSTDETPSSKAWSLASVFVEGTNIPLNCCDVFVIFNQDNITPRRISDDNGGGFLV